MSGVFEYRSIGEPRAAATQVADRIERALVDVDARDMERYGDAMGFGGSSLTADFFAARRDSSLVLAVVARGEIEVTPAAHSEGAPGRVRYSLRTTRGLARLAVFAAGVEFLSHKSGAPVPPFWSTMVIGVIWAVGYLAAWIRVPLLLMRAADGELKPKTLPERTSGQPR